MSEHTCPDWCSAINEWCDYADNGIRVAMHRRKFSRNVSVHVPEEHYDSGAKDWIGDPKLIVSGFFDHDELEDLIEDIRAAAHFAHEIDHWAAERALRGEIDR